MPCPDQSRLLEIFESADRAWLACQEPDPNNLSDEAQKQATLDALAARNAAANRLYEHRVECPVCKSSFIKDRRSQDRP